MQTFQQIFNILLRDIKVELSDEFDRNFERKAFFDRAWKPAIHNTIGSLMMRTGMLRKSITSQIVGGDSIRWTSSVPYADIHNSGGTITITPKMKGFFWYRFRIATGGDNKNINPEALFWRAMALKKIGSTIKIEQRQFIGEHPIVHQSIKEVTDQWLQNDLQPYITNLFKNKN